MFRRIALSALDLSGQPYRERITSPSLTGVRLAVNAGLGLTARTKSSFFSDIQILTEDDGLPLLPAISYYIYRSQQASDPAKIDLFDTIVKCVNENLQELQL